jgi:hypothetical protein
MLDTELSSSITTRFSTRPCDFCTTNLDKAQSVHRQTGADNQIGTSLQKCSFFSFVGTGHSSNVRFQDVSPEELEQLEGVLKKVGKRAESLAKKNRAILES